MARRPIALALAALSLATLISGNAPADEREIKIGTLAPKASPWGKVFQIWQDAVAEQSEGSMKLTFYWNGSQGDDLAMVDKIKAGNQLDGAAVSALGLGRIWKPILALQIPGLFRTYESLDRARDAMKPEIDAAFGAAGFVLAGQGDVGISHTMTKGFACRVPEDLRGHHPVLWKDDVIGPVLFRVIGQVTPVSMTVPAVLPGLENGSVDMVAAPALAGTQLQWSSKLDHIGVDAGGVTMGGLVMKKATLDSLPPDQKKILEDTGKVANDALRSRIRKADDSAFETLKKKMENVTLTPEEQQKWTDVITKTVEQLGQGTFEPELLTKLVKMKS